MKIRKGFSWLLVLVMLLGMIPLEAAHADTCAGNDGVIYSSHKWGKWIRLSEPTCTEPGVEYRVCERCGAGQDREVAPAHKYGNWKVTRAATCTKEGTRTRTCEVCGHVQKGTIAKKAHNYGDWVVTREATCSRTGVSTHTCKTCGAKETKSIPKNPKKHSWGKWTVKKAATCTKSGTEERICKACGKTESRKTDALGHKFGEWTITKQSVNGQPGKKERVCERCNKRETQSFTVKGEAGLTLEAGKITRMSPVDEYNDVYNVAMTLTNSGSLALDVYMDALTDSSFEVVTDAFFGWDITEHKILQPGETVQFVYQVRTNVMNDSGASGRIRQYVDAYGHSEETGARVTATAPIVINLPAQNGLKLAWNDMKRVGEGEDETWYFNLTVTNVSEDWLHVTASADNEYGDLTDQEGFVGWPESGTLTLSVDESYSFSYMLKPSHPDIDKATYISWCWLGRDITVEDKLGHSDMVHVAGWVNGLSSMPAQGFLEGTLQQHARGYIHEDEAFISRADLTLKNISKKEFKDIVIHGVMTTALGTTLHTYTLTPENAAMALKPQESVPFTADLEISAADAFAAIQELDADGRHRIFFSFWADYSFVTDNGETGFGESNLWSGSIEVGEGSVLNHGGVWPRLTGSFDDRLYSEGEMAWINLTLANVSETDTVHGVTFEYYERAADGSITAGPLVYSLPDLILMPGESYELKDYYSYGVSEAAAAKGVVYLDFNAACHSVEYDLTVNCSWHCDLRTKQKDKLSVGPVYDPGKYRVFEKGKLEWHAIAKENLPGSTVSADVVVTNNSDGDVTAVVTSDHPGDKLDGAAEKTLNLKPGEEQIVSLEIFPLDDEAEAGEIHHVITATEAGTDISASGGLDFVLYSGGWEMDLGIPDITLTAGAVVPGWNFENSVDIWTVYVTCENSGNCTLDATAGYCGADGGDTMDYLLDWGSENDPDHFQPGEAFDFCYVIIPTDEDMANGKVVRTLTVSGFSLETEEVVSDAIPFTFQLEDMHPLILSVTGEHRKAGSGQEITVDLALFNQANENVTVGVSAFDENYLPPSADSFTGLPETLTLGPAEVFNFSYTIRPDLNEIDSGEVVRTVKADGGSELMQSSVSLVYKLVPDQIETDLLHLDGEITGTQDLTLNASFDVHLTAENLGNVKLEDVTFKGMAQAANGQCLATVDLAAADFVLDPGNGLQAFPSIIMTADMLAEALSAHGVNAGSIVFTYRAQYIARFADGSLIPGLSNPVTFILKVPDGMDENGGISLTCKGVTCPESPKADDVVSFSLLVTNEGKEDLVGLKVEANKLVGGNYTFLETVKYDPLDIIHPGETRPCSFTYKILQEDQENGLLGFEFVASSESGSRPYVYVARFEWSTLLSETDGEDETSGTVLISQVQANSPPNGQDAFMEDDEIQYTVRVTNMYPFPVTNIVVGAELTDYALDIPVGTVDLNAYEAKELPYSHTVTSLDVGKEKVESKAYAIVVVNDPDSGKLLGDYTVWSAAVVTPVSEKEDENLPIAVSIEKSVISHPDSGDAYKLGEDIGYEIYVVNEHDTTARIDVWDWIEGEEAPDLVASFDLIPGGFSYNQVIHTVTVQDVVNGKVTNQAYAAVLLYPDIPEKTTGYTVWAKPVTVDTMDEEPEEKKEEKKEEPSEGKPICKRVLPEGSDKFLITFCDEHSPVNEKAEQLAAAGQFTEAAALWEKNVNDLYEDLKVQRPDIADAVSAERETFFAQIGAYRQLAASMYGEARAEQSVSDMLRDRCVDLCYALHHPDEPLAGIIPGIVTE